MKTLWICNLILPEFCEEFGVKRTAWEGWISAMLELVQKNFAIEVACCFPIIDEGRMKKGRVNGVSYYSFHAAMNKAEVINDSRSFIFSHSKKFPPRTRTSRGGIFCVIYYLANKRELVFAFFDNCEIRNGLIFGSFDAIYGNGIAGDELASFALAGGKMSGNEDIDETFAFSGSREGLSEQIDVGRGKILDLAFTKEELGEFLGLSSRFFAVNNFCNFFGEAFLTKASARVFAVLGEDLVEFCWHNEGEILEVIFKCIIGLIKPELIEIKDASFVGIEPDGITFGLAEFAACDFVDDEWARVTVGSGVFEALNEVDARSAVAILIGATELKCYVVFAEKMEKIVTLNESVAKFGVTDAGTAFANAFLNKLTIK